MPKFLSISRLPASLKADILECIHFLVTEIDEEKGPSWISKYVRRVKESIY